MTTPATPEPRWTVESTHPGLPYLRWSDDLFLDMGGMDPEAWAALVADVEAARQLPAIEALLNFERARADYNAQLIGKHDPTGLDHLREAEKAWAKRDALAATLARIPHMVCADCRPRIEPHINALLSDTPDTEERSACERLGYHVCGPAPERRRYWSGDPEGDPAPEYPDPFPPPFPPERT